MMITTGKLRVFFRITNLLMGCSNKQVRFKLKILLFLFLFLDIGKRHVKFGSAVVDKYHDVDFNNKKPVDSEQLHQVYYKLLLFRLLLYIYNRSQSL